MSRAAGLSGVFGPELMREKGSDFPQDWGKEDHDASLA